ncbi:PE-PGRS family protein, partial [Streptomyces sp. B1866]|uniref:PE-PGRS family protein n=1 Tax=Streptomyces sp. B1866 TaxID=3075431 RepID=UPI0028927D93
MEAGRALRALRAAVFAAVCVLLAALGHAVMSGAGVPWRTVTAAWAATGAAAWCLAGRERGPLLVTAATVGAQTALHAAFGHAQRAAAHAAHAVHAAHAGGLPPSGGMSAPAVPSAHGMPPVTVCGHAHLAHTAAGGPPLAMAGHGGHGSGPGMWSAHVLAALVCGAWLSGGERAAFRLLRALAVRLLAC